MARMPLVRPRMHRQPVRAGGQRDAPDPLDARPWQVAPVAQHGDRIEVDGKLGGHGETLGRRDGCHPYSALCRELAGGLDCSRSKSSVSARSIRPMPTTRGPSRRTPHRHRPRRSFRVGSRRPFVPRRSRKRSTACSKPPILRHDKIDLSTADRRAMKASTGLLPSIERPIQRQGACFASISADMPWSAGRSGCAR